MTAPSPALEPALDVPPVAPVAPPRTRRRSGATVRRVLGAWTPMLSRLGTIAVVVFGLGILPLLSSRDPALTILRSRSAEQVATPEALHAIRRELGLDAGPMQMFLTWLGGAVQGDWGRSWISGQPVLPGTVQALGISLTLMAFSLLVALALAAALSVSTFRRGLSGRGGRTSGAVAAAFTSLPEFLLSSILLVVFAVWLGLFPPYGFQGLPNVVLPALALGIPAGGLLGRLFSDAVASAFAERWVTTWTVSGSSPARLVLAVTRRALPAVTPQVALVLVGMVGGAVAVEEVFAIPGLGRATLGAAQAQDMPALQAGVVLLMLLAVVLGALSALVRRVLLGPALRAASLPAAVPTPPSRRSAFVLPAVATLLLVGVVVAGLGRDPFTSAFPRLAPPGEGAPLGADASGRDVLARISDGALSTIGTAVVVAVICLMIGLAVGMFPRMSTGPVEITNATPPVIAGLIVASILGASSLGATLAVAAVSWAPLAAHTAALVAEAKAQPHVRIAPVLGVGRVRLMTRYVLPGVIGPVSRHAALRLPTIALALAALGFLGLGPQPPSADWGLVLAEGMPYVERSPLVVIVPAVALVLLSVVAVSLSSLSFDRRRRRTPSTTPTPTPTPIP